MKKHALTMSLALLSATFLLGCQEQGSAPLGPEGVGVQLDKAGPHPHGGGDDGGALATYSVQFSGDEIIGGGSTSENNMLRFLQVEGMDLTIPKLSKVEGGEECFGKDGKLIEGRLEIVDSLETGRAMVSYWFAAKGTDGSDVGKYRFRTFGDLDPAKNWLPRGIGDENTVTGTGELWTLLTSRRNHKLGCTGGGEVSYVATVTRTG